MGLRGVRRSRSRSWWQRFDRRPRPQTCCASSQVGGMIAVVPGRNRLSPTPSSRHWRRAPGIGHGGGACSPAFRRVPAGGQVWGAAGADRSRAACAARDGGPDFVADLEAVRQALSHKLPVGGLEEVLHECVRVTLAQVERRRSGAGKKSAATVPPSGSRYVPVTVRKEVWQRDEGCCAYVGSTGRRCNSRHQVQLHHLDPFAMGGRATAANLTLRCRFHNHHAAEQDYGAEHIARKVASRRARRSASTSPTIPGIFG
jgi:5-methylcytosine-specific restriction endonuclease McrA